MTVTTTDSAMPVTTPGSAIGRITSRFTLCLPKNVKRWRAKAIMVPINFGSREIILTASIGLFRSTRSRPPTASAR